MKKFYSKVYYSGHVQGVGFRYHTSKIAHEFEVCGMVKNLEDGRVYLEVEGEEQEVKGFIEELQSQMNNFIRDSEISTGMREKEMSGFIIG